MSKLYTGSIHHTQHTIRILFKTCYYIFELKKVIFRFCIGGGLAVLGLIAAFPDLLQVLFLAAGCWLIASPDFPSKMRADRALSLRYKVLPSIQTTFFKEHFVLKDNDSLQLSYSAIRYLVEDTDYFFIIMARDSVCMIEKSTLEPSDSEGFKSFLKEKTKIEWKQNKTFFTMSFLDLFKTIFEHRKKSE